MAITDLNLQYSNRLRSRIHKFVSFKHNRLLIYLITMLISNILGWSINHTEHLLTRPLLVQCLSNFFKGYLSQNWVCCCLLQRFFSYQYFNNVVKLIKIKNIASKVPFFLTICLVRSKSCVYKIIMRKLTYPITNLYSRGRINSYSIKSTL